MFNGAHVVIYTQDAEADRAFCRDVLDLSSVDAGDGWLIFALPPAEVAFHPHDTSQGHEFYFMCDDIEDCCNALLAKGVEPEPARDEGWGLLSGITLPGGGRIGFYQPRHGRPG